MVSKQALVELKTLIAEHTKKFPKSRLKIKFYLDSGPEDAEEVVGEDNLILRDEVLACFLSGHVLYIRYESIVAYEVSGFASDGSEIIGFRKIEKK